MIKKLKKQNTWGECLEKLNEVIDAVNAIQGDVKKPNSPWIHWETPTKNMRDEYAEQRKWIGKVCKFWDGKEEEKVFGILTTIDSDCGLSDMCPYWNDTTKNWFEHCEPVKPDDDIIYKGGSNE